MCIDRIPREEDLFKRPFLYMRKGRIKIVILTSMLFLILFSHNTPFIAIKYATLISFFIVVGIIDFRTTDVYFKTTLVGIVLAIIFIIYGASIGINPKSYILTGIISGGIIGLIHLISGGGIGGGDAEILAICGLFLGPILTILVIIISFISAAVIGIALILFKKRSLKEHMPFIPFIAIATIVILII